VSGASAIPWRQAGEWMIPPSITGEKARWPSITAASITSSGSSCSDSTHQTRFVVPAATRSSVLFRSPRESGDDELAVMIATRAAPIGQMKRDDEMSVRRVRDQRQACRGVLHVVRQR